MEVVEHVTQVYTCRVRVGGRIIPFCPFFVFPRNWSLEVDKLTRIFFSLMIALSVLMDDFLSLTMDDFFFPRIFWVD